MGHMAGVQRSWPPTPSQEMWRSCVWCSPSGSPGTASILIGREIGAGRSHQVYEVGLALNTLAALAGQPGSAAPDVYPSGRPGVVFPPVPPVPPACAIATMMMTVQGLLMPVRDFNHCTIVGVPGRRRCPGGQPHRPGPLWLVAIPLAALAGIMLRLDILWVYLAMSGESLVKSFLGMWRLRPKVDPMT